MTNKVSNGTLNSSTLCWTINEKDFQSKGVKLKLTTNTNTLIFHFIIIISPSGVMSIDFPTSVSSLIKLSFIQNAHVETPYGPFDMSDYLSANYDSTTLEVIYIYFLF